jgi:hypothetical protein
VCIFAQEESPCFPSFHFVRGGRGAEEEHGAYSHPPSSQPQRRRMFSFFDTHTKGTSPLFRSSHPDVVNIPHPELSTATHPCFCARARTYKAHSATHLSACNFHRVSNSTITSLIYPWSIANVVEEDAWPRVTPLQNSPRGDARREMPRRPM